jgi:hypothetical protein
VVDVYLTDLDGSLYPPTERNINTPASIVSNSKNMLTFVEQKKCTTNLGACFSYCEGTCFRSFRFQIDPANTEKYLLRVCSKQNSKMCIQISGRQKKEGLQDFILGDNRVFLAHLPVGSYEVVFLNPSGLKIWPSFVLFSPEEVTCPTAFPDGAIKIIAPPPEPNQCAQLARNGNFEGSDTEPKFWLYRSGGIELVRKRGVGKSNAIASVQRKPKASIVQYLDTRCLKMQRGRVYQIRAMIKLEFENGEPYFCDYTKKECPEIGIRSSNDGFYRTLARVDNLMSEVKDNFQPASAFFEISESMAMSNQTLVYIQSNVDGKRMFVDDVSIKLVDRESVLCENIIDMPEELPMRFWRVVDAGELSTVQGPIADRAIRTKPAVRFGKRRASSDRMGYTNWPDIVETTCFLPGSKWKITAQFQLVRQSSRDAVKCDLSANDCPAVGFVLFDRSGKRVVDEKRRSYKTKAWNANDFNLFETTLTLPPKSSKWDGKVSKVQLDIQDFPAMYDLIVGTVQMMRVSD